MEGITQHGLTGGDHISQHPNMWYNIGRWATLICGPSTSIDEIADMKASAISAIGMIAFTNINKVRGKKAAETNTINLQSPVLQENCCDEKLK